MSNPLIAIAETPTFMARAEKRLSSAELDTLRGVLAAEPEAGDLIPGGGGIRKLRIAARGKGKRGGARVIYYYFDRTVPVYLLDVYGKDERDDLDRADLAALAKLTKAIAAAARLKRSRP